MGRPGLTQHRKFRRLATALGGELLARGALEMIWDACYEAGDDYLGDALDVALAARWQGDANALVSALAGAGGEGCAGFIEPDESRPGWRLHDLYDHAPDYVQRRMAREAERKAKGTTISDLRREAGAKGAARPTSARNPVSADTNDGQLRANGKQLHATDSKRSTFADCPNTNVSTPAPAPSTDTKSIVDPVGRPHARARFDFEGCYARYPRHEGRAEGMKAARRKIATPDDFARFSSAVDRYAAKIKRDGKGVEFTLLWSTFVNGRWEDYAPSAPDLFTPPPTPTPRPPEDDDSMRAFLGDDWTARGGS